MVRFCGFPEQRRGGAGVCCPRSISCPFVDCSAQELVWCCSGAGISVPCSPTWLGLHCWGLGKKGLPTPSPAYPRRRSRWAWVSGSPDPQQSSRAQGARGSPAPLFTMVSSGLFAKTAYIAFQSRGAVWDCLCSARSVSCHFADCSPQELGWCSWGDVAWVLSDPDCLGGHCCG